MIDLRSLPVAPEDSWIDVQELLGGAARAATAGGRPDPVADGRTGPAAGGPSTPGGRFRLGEHPVWDVEGDQLLWVDILGAAVHGWSPSTGEQWEVRTSTPVSLVWPGDHGSLLLATADGIALRARDASGLRPDLSAPAHASVRPADMPSDFRFNDGAVDPAGRLWISSMGPDPTTDLGVLYQVVSGPDGLVAEGVVSGLGCGNGVGWSPDGTVCYLVESMTRTVYSFAVDPEHGTLSGGEALLTLRPGGPVPDGLAVDSAGVLWVAVWDGACVLRLSPEGAVLSAVAFPAPRITCPGFGRPGTTDLFVTSATSDSGPETGPDTASGPSAGRHGSGASDHPDCPESSDMRDDSGGNRRDLAGAVFHLDAGTTGLPVTPFREGDRS